MTREEYFKAMRKKIEEVMNPLSYMDNASDSRVPNHQRRFYEFGGRRFKTVEELEKYLISEGINPNRIKPRPSWIPQGGGEADIVWRIECEN